MIQRSFRHWVAPALAFAWVLASFGPARAVTSTDELSRLPVRIPGPALSESGATPVAAAQAWRAFERATAPGWTVAWNEATGLPHRAVPATYDPAVAFGFLSPAASPAAREQFLNASLVDDICRSIYEALQQSYPALPGAGSLRPMAIERQGAIWYAIYEQTADGLPVEGARLDFRLFRDGRLLSLGVSLIPGTIDAQPRVAMSEAQGLAIDALEELGFDRGALSPAADLAPLAPGRTAPEAIVAAGPDQTNHMAWLPVYDAGGQRVETRLTYVVRTDLADPVARLVTWIDAETGQVLQRDNEIRYANFAGKSDAEIQPATPQDPYTIVNLPHLSVTVQGVGSAYTDLNGNFTIPNGDNLPRTLTSALTGRWSHIVDASGPEPLFSATVTPGGLPVLVRWNDSNSQASERDCFYHMGVVHDWVKQINPTFTGLDYEMTGTVNIGQTCNAFWDGSGVNFYSAGGGCTNTGQIADVIYHEYGHGDNQFAYAPASPTGSQHEGFADYHGASITNQPLIGRGFFGSNSYLRTCDNNRQYPAPECGGEVHCEGEVIAGALWHMRQNLVAELGQAAGVALSDHLFHYAMFGRDATYEGYYFDVLGQDDDNGTLADGTPHDTSIITAFDQHNIGPGFTLEIVHSQLNDTEAADQAYRVAAVLSSPADLVTGASLFYKTGPIGGPFGSFTQVAMAPTGGIREYEAFIPAQPLGTEVRYYLSASMAQPTLNAVAPAGAPASTYGFRVEIDALAPAVTHTPLADKSAAIWPATVSATVTDNQGVSTVEVEWKLDGIDQAVAQLAQVGSSDVYAGNFGGSVTEGQTVSYRIKASDTAMNPNVTFSPAVGYNTFQIVHLFSEGGESGAQDMTHDVVTIGFRDQWHLSTTRVHSGGTAWKFGDTGGGVYLDTSDGALYTPTIHLGVGATLSFWHWISAEEDANATAWDGAVVEISSDGGQTWPEIAPNGGYTHTIINNPASPFPGGYPCWSGFYGWRQATFDLSSFVGQYVRLRFRFGSDGYVTYEGWYLDDLVVDPGTQAAGVENDPLVAFTTSLLGATPNPSAKTSLIRFTLARGAGPVSLDVVDVAGRKIRSLANGSLAPGLHALEWDGSSDSGQPVAAGVYFVRLAAGRLDLTSKVLRIQ